ncbi:MAG: hypothetical protein D6805_08925 [Planctomycetota bacterium]|nr:MAG: hypothetical protein D6805_08925 [Planctomycetota bacterium]
MERISFFLFSMLVVAVVGCGSSPEVKKDESAKKGEKPKGVKTVSSASSSKKGTSSVSKSAHPKFAYYYFVNDVSAAVANPAILKKGPEKERLKKAISISDSAAVIQVLSLEPVSGKKRWALVYEILKILKKNAIVKKGLRGKLFIQEAPKKFGIRSSNPGSLKNREFVLLFKFPKERKGYYWHLYPKSILKEFK